MLVLLDTFRADRAVELRAERGVGLDWQDLGLSGTQTRMRIGDPGGNRAVRRWDGPTGRRARYLETLLVRRGLSSPEASEYALRTLRAVWETQRRADEGAPSAEDRLLLSVGDAVRMNPDWWRFPPAIGDGGLRPVSPNRARPPRGSAALCRAGRRRDGRGLG